MIALTAYLLFGAVHFVEQAIPGLEVGSRAFPAALSRANAVPVDLDRDGEIDLLLPNGLWMQRDGTFSRQAMIALPDRPRHASLHIEHGRLYVFADGLLTAYSFVAQLWQPDWEASLDLEPEMQSANAPLFYDLDADGRAELVLPVKQNLRVFRMQPGAPSAGELNVYPPLRPRLLSTANLWTSTPRQVTGAIASRDVHLTLSDGSLITREALRVSNRAFDYQIVKFAVSHTPAGFAAERTQELTYSTLPDAMFPCHLRQNGPVAFLGARALGPNRLRLGQTVTEVLVATEPQTPIASLRTKSSPAHLALADFDNDGDYDLLTQANSLDSRPPREILIALASARRIRHEFFVHVQESTGLFDLRPRRAFAVELDLDGVALEGGARWNAYRRGELTCSAADFNGDGRADIAAWTTAARIDVWLNHEGVFQRKPDTSLQPGAGQGFLPADVDADGKADIVILAQPGTGGPARVYFAR